MINYVLADMLSAFEKGETDYIAHGCNCFHTMGAGVAGLVAQMWPEALRVDEMTPYGENHKCGSFSVANVARPGQSAGWIFNLYTQFLPGRQARQQYITESLKAVFGWFRQPETGRPGADRKLHIPLLGCGIGGLILEEFSEAVEAAQLYTSGTGLQVVVCVLPSQAEMTLPSWRQLTKAQAFG